MKTRDEIIRDYIAAYNSFDIERMLVHLDEEVRFEKIANGVSTMTLVGVTSFKEQAEQAKHLFAERTQTLKSIKHLENTAEAEIQYKGTLAGDLPNGMKKGEELHLQGKSIFKFSEGKIISLTDIS